MAKLRRRSKGEGSIFQRKDGRYVAEMTLEDGKRKQFYGKTQKEALEKLRKAQREQEQGILATGPQQTVKQFLEYWLEDVHKLKVRPGTYEVYRTVFLTSILSRGLGIRSYRSLQHSKYRLSMQRSLKKAFLLKEYKLFT